MVAKIGSIAAAAAMVIGAISIDSDGVFPILLVLIGAGFLLGVLCHKWDDIMRTEKEECEDVDIILWRERHNRW